MTTTPDRELANEQAADQRYREALVDLEKRRARRGTVQGPRNTLWTGSGLPRGQGLPVGGLVGRVALHEPSDIVEGADFYIGSAHIEEPGLTVYSWTAPIACTFFRGRPVHALYDHVAVTRSLTQRGGRIVSYEDDVVSEPVPDTPFAPRALSIPAAPSRRPLPAKKSAPPPKPPSPSPSTDQEQPGPPSPSAPPTPPRPQPSAQRPLRAENALRAAITAPRQDHLSSVLATLQADQHDLVTRNPATPLVIQGHPGTGKTIIAAHRAAYLVHTDTPAAHRRSRVLLVGPTDPYAHHVRGVVTDLISSPDAVQITSLPRLMWTIRRLPNKVDGTLPEQYRDVDPELEDLADLAADFLASAGLLRSSMKDRAATATVYEALRTNQVANQPLTSDHDWSLYLKKLPAWRNAVTMRRFLPLLAQCAHSSRPYRDDTYDHVLVDEAQDVTPLEWRLLTAVNPKHSWTLLGDMNQRRSDWTYHSWTDVGVGLGITQAGQQLPPDVIERGYRTTAAIMQFAAKLLPRAQRTVDSLQSEGTPPQIHRVKGASVHEEAVTDALRLHSAHPHGTIAIIGTDPRQTARALRLRGFTTDPHNRRRWVNNAQKIWVLSAEDARGLEFDAVVIVEPAEFPMNYGRHGLLYTSLTRANRDLVIVHRRPLPDALRKGHRSK